MTISGQSIGRVFPLKAIGTILSLGTLRTHEFRDECDDAIAMCEVAFWDDSVNRTDFLAPG